MLVHSERRLSPSLWEQHSRKDRARGRREEEGSEEGKIIENLERCFKKLYVHFGQLKRKFNFIV